MEQTRLLSPLIMYLPLNGQILPYFLLHLLKIFWNITILPQLAMGSQKKLFTHGHIIHSEISPSPAYKH